MGENNLTIKDIIETDKRLKEERYRLVRGIEASCYNIPKPIILDIVQDMVYDTHDYNRRLDQLKTHIKLHVKEEEI